MLLHLLVSRQRPRLFECTRCVLEEDLVVHWDV